MTKKRQNDKQRSTKYTYKAKDRHIAPFRLRDNQLPNLAPNGVYL